MSCNLNYSILAFAIICHLSLFAQKKEIAFNIGSGTNYTASRTGYINRIYDKAEYRIGLDFYTTPKKAPFRLRAGVNYDQFKHKELIRIPLGLDFQPGKRLHAILGIGPTFSFLLNQSEPNYIESENSGRFNTFQLLMHFKLGLGYKINNRFSINSVLNLNKDVSAFYLEYKSSPGGAEYIEPIKTSDLMIQLTLRRTLGKLE